MTLRAQEGARPPRSVDATGRYRIAQGAPKPSSTNAADLAVVRDSQKQALEQAQAMKEGVDDPRGKALIEAVEKALQ